MNLNISKEVAHDLRNIAQRIQLIKEDITLLSKAMTTLFLDLEGKYEEGSQSTRCSGDIETGLSYPREVQRECQGENLQKAI